jgi:hypothetical protein
VTTAHGHPPAAWQALAERPLLCHPANPCGIPLQLTASLMGPSATADEAPGGWWCLRYELRGDLQALLIPEALPPAPADGLWQHTCFEAFVAIRGASAYREFNFSPSGQWAAYAFEAERVRDPASEPVLGGLAPRITWQPSPTGLVLEAWLPPAAWPEHWAAAPLDIGLSAVIETREHHRSYWALHHPVAQPDFHHRGGFALQLPPFSAPDHTP